MVRIGDSVVLATESPMPTRAKESTSFRSPLITANTPMPADVFPADLSSAKAGRANAKF